MFNVKEYRKLYYQKNKKRIRSQQRRWREENRDGIKNYNEEYRIKNRDRFKKTVEENMRAWKELFPTKPICQICGERIYFNEKNKKEAIHFDHRHGKFFKKISAATWLRRHQRTNKNIKIWKTFDFGMLCAICNHRLPTKNRKQYLKKVIQYVFGVNCYICKSERVKNNQRYIKN